MINNLEIPPDRSQVPEIFIRHLGTWQGEYIKTDKQGQFSRSFVGSFTIAIAGNQYRQVNKYEYADGSRLQLDFEGEFVDQILTMRSRSYSDFEAIAWDAGQGLVCFQATKTQDDALIKFIETMTLLDDHQRVRSTQAFKNGIFDGISFIEEIRIA
ncbi:hypothetical protein H6F42_08730 [Pseudanabaena sp. FACHB-1998]|uniref:DUF3598 family protein n=1 Tax=Pseudanabaena sp. FACHB-1998 TaxID=2692858 RepID=UPI0016817BC4|nr:DUF3598 family protein [Pseudanabaena sp. FACHB-1998]MBD2176992.1 hypothetical protein [Pseudanabaena sp. FACHB-1998]